MKKIFLILALFAYSFASAQEGISFKKCNWSDALRMAKQENKLIFVDFYTQWCGPCLNMAQNVFVLHSVGTFYNENFISLKIDAENGVGVELAKKYNIRSYPTYLFIDPNSEKIVHQSSGRQDAGTFIFTGKSALDEKKQSVYLNKQYALGNSTTDFLLDYAMYKGSVYDKNAVKEVCDKLQESGEFTLENEKAWNLFVSYVTGIDNFMFEDLVSNVVKLRKKYGADIVDAKFYAETQYSRDRDKVVALPYFQGKDAVLMYIEYEEAFRAKDYSTAANVLDRLCAYNGALKEEVCKFLYYAGRSNLYGEYPDKWHDKCLEICRYVAYNHPRRDDASIHQLYAAQLEKKFKRDGNVLPVPKVGVKEYSMRPASLKTKPTK